MNKLAELSSLSFDQLSAVAGGAANKDAKTTVGGGVVLDRTYKERTDSGYKLDAIKAACERKHTTTERGWFSDRQVVDQAKAAQCVLDHTE